jgi:hypothetical protein
LDEAIVAIGFAKDRQSLRENLPVFNALVRRVLKMRMMGSAALSLAYVASGRFDVYLESGISDLGHRRGGIHPGARRRRILAQAVAGRGQISNAGQQRFAAPKSRARRPPGAEAGVRSSGVMGLPIQWNWLAKISASVSVITPSLLVSQRRTASLNFSFSPDLTVCELSISPSSSVRGCGEGRLR